MKAGRIIIFNRTLEKQKLLLKYKQEYSNLSMGAEVMVEAKLVKKLRMLQY